MKAADKLAMTRRLFLAAAPFGLAGCAATGQAPSAATPSLRDILAGPYGEIEDNGITVPEVDLEDIDPRFLRQTVAYAGKQAVGTIIVDTPNRHIHLVRPEGKAIRYGCGVGRAGYEFKGGGYIGRTAIWPRWAPTSNMIAAMPERYKPLAGGMPGGIENPLGARALYIWRDGAETNYRIHGTNEPESIGTAVSSGCIRMFNHDIIDLHRRVQAGAKVVVIHGGSVANA